MENLIVVDKSLEEVFSQLSQNVEIKLHDGDGTVQFHANSPTVAGKFQGSCYSNSVSFVKCSISLQEKISIYIKSTTNPSFLYFIFCNKGNVFHKQTKSGNYRPIHEYQTTVISPGEKGMEFIIPQHQKNEFIIIKIQPRIYSKTEKITTNHNSNIQRLYENFDRKGGYTHYGSYNLKICEYFKEIENIKENGFVKNIFLEGQIKLILAILIKQYNGDLHNQNKINDISVAELKRVKEVTDYIRSNPSAPHSIKKLTYTYAISPSKLQKGFKKMHKRTVADFIKNLRVERAEEMIKNRDCTISEIVYDIGFTSRSYFSKIFKEKYNCSPKDYQEKLKLDIYN